MPGGLKIGKTQNEARHCSFCNESQQKVTQLVASDSAAICDSCVTLCLDVMEERRAVPDKEILVLGNLQRAAKSFLSTVALPIEMGLADISLPEFLKQARLEPSVTLARVLEALHQRIDSASKSLAKYRQARVAITKIEARQKALAENIHCTQLVLENNGNEITRLQNDAERFAIQARVALSG